MSARTEAVDDPVVDQDAFDFEAVFETRYGPIARLIARVVRDPARAEELAVEVFVDLWANPRAQRTDPGAWLYRVALRRGAR